MRIPPGFYSFAWGIVVATIIAAIQIIFGLGAAVAGMTRFLSEPAVVLALAGVGGMVTLIHLQTFHFDQKLANRFDFRRLRVDFDPSLSGCRVHGKLRTVPQMGLPLDVV